MSIVLFAIVAVLIVAAGVLVVLSLCRAARIGDLRSRHANRHADATDPE